eukprot:1209761-Rhodomonas_salina.1
MTLKRRCKASHKPLASARSEPRTTPRNQTQETKVLVQIVLKLRSLGSGFGPPGHIHFKVCSLAAAVVEGEGGFGHRHHTVRGRQH